MQMSERMRLLRRGWYQSLTGAFEKPPAMPEVIYYPESHESETDLQVQMPQAFLTRVSAVNIFFIRCF